jgi:hypothetical protein
MNDVEMAYRLPFEPDDKIKLLTEPTRPTAQVDTSHDTKFIASCIAKADDGLPPGESM